MIRPGALDRLPPPTRPWVFAVEDTAIQVTWRTLPPGPIRFTIGDTSVEVNSDGGAGAVDLSGLPPAAELDLTITGDGVPSRWRHQPVRTLAPPPGAELARFATISDMHVGEVAFGFRAALLEDPVPDEAHPVRATRAALDAMQRWGATQIVVKGDLTHDGRAKDWACVGRLLADAEVPTHVLLGNHDHYGAAGEPTPETALAPFGIEPIRGVAPVEVPGLNLVLVDTTVPHHHGGSVARGQAQVVDLLRANPHPAVVALHHHLERRAVPVFLPRGVRSHEGERFLDAVRWAQPRTLVTSGHTHRHRRRQVGSLVVTEVGSPKDFPGSWAGYVVHEGGIRQVVRRIADPALLRWTDHSARAAFGAWGAWSPGLRSHRCFSHTWPG